MEKATAEEVKDMVADLEKEISKEEPKETPKEEPKAENAEVKPEVKPEVKTEPDKPKVEFRARKSDAIPAAKFHEVRHELQAEREAKKRLEQELEELRKAKSDESLDDIAKRISADKADPEVVKEIILAARQPKTDTSALEARLAAVEAEKAKSEDANRYRDEEDVVLSKFPELKPYAKELKTAAYTAGNENIPLEYLALKLRTDLNLVEKAAPSESVSVPPSGKPKDYTNLTEEEFSSLSDKELDVFIKRNLEKRR